ncbi:MAG: response regulator transcription factor [Oscillospiraceae bacterium]|jgi:DNA-binding response OmpR family regulator|nr:response regulator transcription factor [Oscillospiraceae bacterium]
MHYKILIVDDDMVQLLVLQDCFEMMGYTVLTATDGKNALDILAVVQPDVILLDVMMPNLNGIELCKRIREHITCPIIIISSYTGKEEILRAFAAGADEFIKKPVDGEIVVAQIDAHLRREERRNHNVISARFFGELIIDYAKRKITIAGKNIKLSKKEFDIVELLSRHKGLVFDRERIYDKVWGLEGEGDSNTVTEHISNIRAKFNKHTEHNYIETAWGIGYKFNG